jgi:hypothetical protein
VTAEVSQIERTAPSGVALSPAGVPLSDSQIISHASSQIGMQSAATTTVAPVPGTQMRTQAMRLTSRRNRMIGILAAMVLVAGGGMIAISQMGGESSAAPVGDSSNTNVIGGALQGLVGDTLHEDEGPPVVFRAAQIRNPKGGGEPEYVIEMDQVKVDQGLPRITWRIACAPRCKITDVRSGKELSQSPLTIEFFEDASMKVRLKLSADGYEDRIVDDLSGKAHYDRTFKLVRKLSPTVKVAITCEPGGCEIFDPQGVSQGVAPRTLELPRGDQTLVYTVKRDGYMDGTIPVVPDRDRKEKATLVKAPRMVTHRIECKTECTIFDEDKNELGKKSWEGKIVEVKGKVKYSVVFPEDEKKPVSVSLSGTKDDSKTAKPPCEKSKRKRQTGPRRIYEDDCAS